MNNGKSGTVIKITDKKKKPAIDKWKAQISEHGDKLDDRLYDAIRLADEETNDEGVPEEFADCMILGVLTAVLVNIAHARNVLGPEALIKLVEHQIEHQIKENLRK